MHTAKITAVIAVLLALILTSGIFANRYLSKTADKMEDHIAKIETNTMNGDWKTAEAQLSLTKKEWSGTGKAWSILIDHLEIDNIDMALSKMEKYIYTRDAPLTLAETATLKQLIKHIPDKEAFKIKNIL